MAAFDPFGTLQRTHDDRLAVGPKLRPPGSACVAAQTIRPVPAVVRRTIVAVGVGGYFRAVLDEHCMALLEAAFQSFVFAFECLLAKSVGGHTSPGDSRLMSASNSRSPHRVHPVVMKCRMMPPVA